MGLDDYAQALGAAQKLVPDLRDIRTQELQQQGLQMQNQGFALQNHGVEQDQAAAVEAKEKARLRSQRMAADLAGFHAKPTSEGAVRLMTTYAELRDPIKDAWSLQDKAIQSRQLSQLAQVRAAMANGRADLAKGIIQRHVDAGAANGEDVSGDRDQIAMIDSDPDRFLANMDGMIAAITGPEKFAETSKGLADTAKTLGDDQRARQLQPALVRRGTAEASEAETKATYAPQVIQSNLANDEANRRNIDSQITTRVAQLDIARDTLTSNVQLKLQEMEDAGARPDPGSVQIMNGAVVSGSANAAMAEQTRGLADQFEASPARGGAFSDWAEVSKRTLGRQDAVSLLRGRYQQLINNAAIKSLPPGPASDKDIKIAREGFPSTTAPREYIVSWLRGMAKMQDIAASGDNARAEWIAGNGNLGNAKRDLVVNGVQIPRGTSFVDYQKRTAATGARQQIPPRSYMEFAR